MRITTRGCKAERVQQKGGINEFGRIALRPSGHTGHRPPPSSERAKEIEHVQIAGAGRRK
jgi:hypothetical protein